MSKVPCGGFKLDENFLGMNENDELSLVGGGGEGKAYQQLVTDGDGKATWEDRLAYVATEEQVIFSQENIEFTEKGGRYGALCPTIASINEGERYCVDFDGNSYISTAFAPMPGNPLLLVGNASLFGTGDDTGEPFLIVLEDTKSTILTALTGSSHNVSIYAYVETIHKIQQQYLPEKKKFYVDTKNTGPIYLDSGRENVVYAEDFISAVNSGGIDFIALNISTAEVHLQMIDYRIIKENGSVTVGLSNINDASVIEVLTYTANSSLIDS